MTRMPLLRDDQVGPPELVDAIRARRGGELLDLDRLLLHSPALAAGWNALFGHLRGSALQLRPLWRELAMCGVAVINGADYEFGQHAPLYLQAGGSPAQLVALRELAEAGSASDPAFDAEQQAVLALIVEMTRRVAVSDAVYAQARAVVGSDAAMLELIGVIAAYNMVSRVLVAAQLHA